MTRNEHTRIVLAEGGNIFRQGEHVKLSFSPRDYAGNVVDLSDKDISVAIWNRKGVMYEGTASYDVDDQLIRMMVEETLEHGEFNIEFTATSAFDPSYRQKFPSSEFDGRISITPSSDNMDVVGVKMTTVAQLRQEQEEKQQTFEAAVIPRVESVETKTAEMDSRLETGIAAFTDATEIVDARMGEVNLREFNRKTTEKLAETLKKTDTGVLSLNAFTEEDRAVIQGLAIGEINAVLGEKNVKSINVDDKAITPKQTSFLIPSKNIFDKNTVTLNHYVDPDWGTVKPSSTNDSSDFIEVKPLTNYVKNVKGHVAFYDSNKTYISGINESTLLANVSFQTPSNAANLRFSIKKSEGFSIETTQLEEGVNSTPYISNEAFSIDTENLLNNALDSSYNGENWASVGDSITDAGVYQPLVADYFGLIHTKCGFSGRTTAGLTQTDVISSIPTDADIITVMAGTNDQGQNVPIDDVDGYEYSTGTYPGSIRRMIQLLQENFPNAKIIFATCVGGRGLVAGENMLYQPKNTLGYTTEDYAKKCKEVCHEMSIPVIDVFANSGINQLNRATYIADLVHPNANGYKKLANVFINGFKVFESVKF